MVASLGSPSNEAFNTRAGCAQIDVAKQVIQINVRSLGFMRALLYRTKHIKIFIISRIKRYVLAKYRVSHPGFYVFSIISLAILLVLSGFLISALVFSDYYNKKFREDISLLAELRSDLSDADVDDAKRTLSAMPEVKETSVKFVSREDALAEMYGELGEEATIESMENPFSDMFVFSIEAEAFEEGVMEALAENIESTMPVRQVHYPKDYFDDVFSVLNTIKNYLVVIILIALAMTGILIHHIMRLNVVAQQRQIKTMELVGAEPSFIRKPFVKTGLRMGFNAWIVAVAISSILWIIFLGPSGFLIWLLSVPGIVGVLILLGISIGVCLVSTYLAVTQSLRTSVLRRT